MSELSYLDELWNVILRRLKEADPNSYTYKLISKGKGHVARKFGEEAVELIVASLYEGKERVVSEAADVLYHFLVLLAANGVSIYDVVGELEKRARHRGR